MFRRTLNPVVFILIATFIMLAGASSCQPKITKQPVDLTVKCGETATFSLTASGLSLKYQWEHSVDGSTWTAIPGATASVITLLSVTNEDNGSKFRCIVSNNSGKVTSNAATLTVTLFSVIYNGNGSSSGSVPVDTMTYKEGLSASVLGNTGNLVKSGFTFAGWNTQADGNGTNRAPSTNFAMDSADVTLYAKWTDGIVHAIGELGPSGVGIVFYITDGGLHGMESAPTGWYETGTADPLSVWSSVGYGLIGTLSTAIGTGSTNTDAIIAQAGHTTSAAKLCRDYRGGDKTDWFLPSLDELNQMYLQKDVICGFAATDYWCSSEGNANRAWAESSYDGFQYYKYNKGLEFRVRPARAF